MCKLLDMTWIRMLMAGAREILVFNRSRGPYRPVEPLPEEGIVDMHCHVAGIGAGGSGCFISNEFRKNWRFPLYLKSFGVSEQELLEKSDSLVVKRLSQMLDQSKFVEKAVVLAMDGVVSDGLLDTYRTQVYVPNEFVQKALESVERYKNNLLFGASVNPYRNDALARLDWAKKKGAVLVKWLPSVMNIDPSDLKLEPFYKKLAELNLPLLTHAGEDQSVPAANDELCDPERLRLPLECGVKVIAAHIASTGSYQGECSTSRLLRMMREYSNLYSDISSLTQVNKLGYMKEALTHEKEFKGRLFYGSDFPLINTKLVCPCYYLGRLTLRQIKSISSLKNRWDVDVKIKQDLGTPTDVFAKSRELLPR
ncbi:MAG: amidohydrolase family protein [Syntrophales bacterium]